MPRSVSSISSAVRALASSPPAQRVASRPRVVVGARPHRPGAGGQLLLDRLDDRPQLAGVERGVHEQEVERQVQLVLAVAVERDQLVELEHVGLPHEDPVGRRRASRQRLSTSWTSGRFIENTCFIPNSSTSGWSSVGRGRVVAQLAVVDDRVADVDPEARDAAVVPEAQDRVELVADGLAPPVQVGLGGQEVVQVVLAGRLVQRPRRARRTPTPSCWAARRRVRGRPRRSARGARHPVR